jgi:hypothetical protein
VRGAIEPARIENAAQPIEASAGAERPELGIAALRTIEIGKSCAEKKAAVETIRLTGAIMSSGEPSTVGSGAVAVVQTAEDRYPMHRGCWWRPPRRQPLRAVARTMSA